MKALAKPAITQVAHAPATRRTTPTVLRVRRSSLNERKRTRDTIRKDSTSTMTAVEPSLTSLYSPALWLTITMNTSKLAAGGMGRPRVNLPDFLLPDASPRRESTLKRARRIAPAQT